MQLPQIVSVTRISGKGRGKKMGIPTINFQIPQTLSLPYGIYAGWLTMDNSKYPAAIHFGPRPVFNETDPSLEAYVLDQESTDVPNAAKLEFVKYIREVRSFPTTHDMLKRIEIDIKEVKKALISY